MNSFIIDLSVLFLIIAGISFIIKLIQQPIILGYILSGFLFALLFVQNNSIKEYVFIFSELGLTFLLFLIGLEFNFKDLKEIGKDIIITTLLQSMFFFGTAFFLSRFFGFNNIESIYLSILFMFSSTLLVAKWIEDKKDNHTLYGKIVLGTLIMQDLLAILFFTFLNLSRSTEISAAIYLPFGGLLLLFIAFVSSRYLLNPLIKFTLRYPELMFIFSMGICFFFVKISSLLGYTPTIGAFIGGIVLANTVYKNDIYSRLKPLIIFFTMLFFVGLGFQLNQNLSFNMVLFAIILSLIGLVLKPFMVFLTLIIRGYDQKTSIRAGLNLAQFSEFGIIIALTGISSAVIPLEIGAIIIIAVVITIVLSSYIIKNDERLTNILCRYLYRFKGVFPEKKNLIKQVNLNKYSVIFIGYYELSKDIFSKFQDFGGMLVIENDPRNILRLKKESIPYIYNSVSNPYFFESLQFDSVSLLVSNLVDIEDNLMILKKLKKDNPVSQMIVTAKSLKDSLILYEAGADYVLYSKEISENHLSVLIEDYSRDINKLIEKRVANLERLKRRENIQKESETIQYYTWTTFLKKISKYEQDVWGLKDKFRKR
ncbi:MAG: cation:proton antiporter [Nanoarchaeota archaeon]|nr:cation:proton antiporter [Nanoarchaeota archaeon]MBU1643623.1 cation:proton antiporter [Nanoarchaeota archaeon]MBU1976795.1 cation:proton antiporter [Nanoarchaeota archaeon]